MDKIALLCLMDTVTLDLRKILLTNGIQIEKLVNQCYLQKTQCLINMKREDFLLNLTNTQCCSEMLKAEMKFTGISANQSNGDHSVNFFHQSKCSFLASENVLNLWSSEHLFLVCFSLLHMKLTESVK